MTDIVVKRFRWSYYEYGVTRAKITQPFQRLSSLVLKTAISFGRFLFSLTLLNALK